MNWRTNWRTKLRRLDSEWRYGIDRFGKRDGLGFTNEMEVGKFAPRGTSVGKT